MSDVIQVQVGAAPWQPTPDTELVEVLHAYDGPLLALLRQRGTQYMARCIVGELAPVQLWVYSRLEEVDLGILLDGNMAQAEEAAERLSHGAITAAISDDERGIRLSAEFDVPKDLGSWDLRGWIARALKELAAEAATDSEKIEAFV